MSDQILDNQEVPKRDRKFQSPQEAREFLKIVRVQSQEAIDKGIPKYQIMADMVSEFGSNYDKNIANIISFTAPKEKITKVQLLKWICWSLTIAFLLIQLPERIVDFTNASSKTPYIIAGILWLAFGFYVTYGFIKNRLQMFNLILIVMGINLVFNIFGISEKLTDPVAWLQVLIIFGAAFVSIKANKILFGKFYNRMAKRDSSGNFIFPED